ncbi:MAG: hypothetical protein R2811_14840 [Flavobacteriales bacterium]
MPGLMMGCVLFTSTGCGNVEPGPDRPVARAFEQVLSWDDLRKVIPPDASGADSAAMAEQYIEMWLRQQAVLHMAEQNQVAGNLDMEAQLEDYRRSLVIFGYEQALVDQKLDTAVNAADIETWYTEHQPNFELKEAVIRIRWFKVNEPDKRELRRMSERFLHGDVDDLHELELWLARNAVTIIDHSTSWYPVTTVKAEMEMPEASQAADLTRTGKQVITSDNGAWFIDVVEYRAQNSISPLDMVSSDIRAILLNQRKLQLIEDMRASVYAQAIENKDVERFAP